MPLRFRAPYIPRLNQPRPGVVRAPAAGRGRGAVGIGGVDLTPTGNPGVDLVKAINATMQQNRQNAVANQILNTQNPPRAGLVGAGVNPATGQANVLPAHLNTLGSAPQTGGLGELQMRQAMQQQDLADQLQRARLASEIALARQRSIASRGNVAPGGSGSQWRQSLQSGQPGQPAQPGQPGQPGVRSGKAGKAAAYVPNSGDVQNDPATDDMTKIAADFNATYGGGSGGKGQGPNLFSKFASNISNLRPDGKGNLVLTDPNGNPITDKDGLPSYSIPAKDATYWQRRVNAARARSGLGYLGDLEGTNPNSGQPAGSMVNPVAVDDNLTLRSLPNNTYFRASDGSVHQKVPQATQPQEGVQQAAPAQSAAPAPDDEQAAEEQAAQEDTETSAPEEEDTSEEAVSQSDEQRRAMLAQAMQQPGAGTLYPVQDVFS